MDLKHEIYSTKVRAGKRTYFFDVKETFSKSQYIVLTESKRISEKGYEKHKVFLYRDDFYKILEALKESIEFIETNFPEPELGNKIEN